MSTQSVESILSKAISDEAFAELLLSAPDQALAGYELTEEEQAKLRNLTRADFEQYAQSMPEERVSLGRRQ